MRQYTNSPVSSCDLGTLGFKTRSSPAGFSCSWRLNQDVMNLPRFRLCSGPGGSPTTWTRHSGPTFSPWSRLFAMHAPAPPNPSAIAPLRKSQVHPSIHPSSVRPSQTLPQTHFQNAGTASCTAAKGPFIDADDGRLLSNLVNRRPFSFSSLLSSLPFIRSACLLLTDPRPSLFAPSCRVLGPSGRIEPYPDSSPLL